MGMAVRGVERLAVCSDHRQTQHCHSLAPQVLPSVLELQNPSRPTGAAGGFEKTSEIRRLSRENPLWGAPRIHGELLKLGIDVGETDVGKYLVRHRQPPSQSWRTFLENHVKTMVSVDFFTVPTISFQLLYVFLVLAHDRRASSTSTSPPIPPPNGLPSNRGKPFPSIRSRDIFFVTATASLAVSSAET